MSRPIEAAPDAIAVGAEVLHVRRILGGVPWRPLRCKIVRETRCQWVDDDGYRFWKSDRACAGYVNEFLMTEAEYKAAGGVL